MSKRLPIIVGVLAVIIVIAAAAVFTKSKKSSQETPVLKQAEEKSQEATSKGSIKSLIGLGKNVTCTVTYPSADMTVKGTVYVAGDSRFRADFITNQDNKEIDSHMIQEGGFSYIWSSASPQGTKMKIEENVPTPTAGPQSQNMDLESEVDYQCSNWSVDNSQFTPPSNIQFMEIVMPTPQTNPTNMTNQSQQQAICDQITDPDTKAACLSTISGN